MAVGSFKLPNVTASAPAADWTRPADWLAMPTIGAQEFIGLLAVTDDESNHIALTCQGAYTVDWGDGVTENVATNVKAQHTYTYSAISSGTLSTRGYKQVLVRVTPQAGQNLTKVDLNQQNSILAKLHTVSWLDLHYNGSNITSIVYGGGGGLVSFHMVESVRMNALGAITSFAGLFSYLFAGLQTVTITGSSSVTNFSTMFYNCPSLKYVDLNVSSGSSFDTMFGNCYSLQKAPLLNFKTTGTISCLSMFASCSSLREVPLINTIAVTAVHYMFQNCTSLQSIPLLNTQSVTNFSFFTSGCNLQQLPNFNTAAGTDFNSMLGGNSLAKGAFQGTRYAISYANKCLSQSAIVDIFNGLGTAVGTPTINVSSNPGRAALTAGEILIATAKGWIVV
jgi:surface protein